MERTEAALGDRIRTAQLGVGRAAAECDHVSDFLGRVAELAAATVGAEEASFWRFQAGRATIEPVGSRATPGARASDAVRSFVGAASTAEPEDDILRNRDAIAVGWRAGDTQLGALCAAQPRAPGGFGPDDGLLLRTIAYSTGNVYDHLEMLERLRVTQERLGQMMTVSQTLNSILDPDVLVNSILGPAMEMLGCDAGAAGLRRPEGMVCKTFFLGNEAIPIDHCWAPGQGTPGWCLVHRAPYLTNDAIHDDQFLPVLPERLTVKRALSTPIIDAKGEVLGFFALYNKATDFDEGDRELMASLANSAAMALQNALAYRRLGELEQVKSDFLNLAAHELRGPVATARGQLEMLADSKAPWQESQRETMLAVATSKLDHIRFLVDQMLTTARLEEQRVQLDLQDIDVRELVEHALRDVAYAVKPGHSLVVDPAFGPMPVRADRRRLEAVLANLIENACKYSPGGGEIRVRCSAAGTPAWAEVVVEDEGVGIAPGDLPQLFTRFGRIVTSENSHIPGTGLGLYLSRQLALMHGGDITVESEPGRGSRFRLRLPLAVPAEDDAGANEFRRRVGELARKQGDRDSAQLPMLPGENPSTTHPEDARHWAVVYQELLKVKEEMLDQLAARRWRTRAAQSEVDRDEESLRLDVERFRAHVHYWQERAAALSGSGPQVSGS